MILASNFVEFLIFLRARAELVEALIYTHLLSEKHVFEDPVELKKQNLCRT